MLKVFTAIFLVLYSASACAFCLLGSVTSTKKFKSFAVLAPEEKQREYYFFDEDDEPRPLTFVHIGETYLERRICDITARFTCFEELGRTFTLMNGECWEDADFLVVKEELEHTWAGGTEISRAYRDHLTTGFGLAKTLMQAGVLPANDKDGEQIGYEIWNIDQDSIYEAVGLKDGDIVTALNGQQLRGASEAVSTLLNLRNENFYNIELLRDGYPMNIGITVK